MAKGGKSRGRRSNNQGGYNGNSGDLVRLKGHHLVVFQTDPDPSGAARFRLHPSPAGVGGTRFVDLNVIYSQYRWLKMKFTFLSGGTQATPSAEAGAMTLGVIPNSALTSVPVSARDIMEMDHSALSFQGQSVPTVLKIPTSLLRGEKMYYETNILPAIDAPGSAIVAVTDAVGECIAGQAFLRVDWEIEYYGRVPGNIVLQRARDGFVNFGGDSDLARSESFYSVQGEPPVRVTDQNSKIVASSSRSVFGRR